MIPLSMVASYTHARGVTHCLCLHVDVLKLHPIRTREMKLGDGLKN